MRTDDEIRSRPSFVRSFGREGLHSFVEVPVNQRDRRCAFTDRGGYAFGRAAPDVTGCE
jgi:hypothetical protein